VKSLATIFISAAIGLAFSGVAMAQVKPATADTDRDHISPQATFLTGTVTSLDRRAGTLVVKASDRQMRLSTDSKSARAALDKLAVGDRCEYSRRVES
jgi:hypothetical protein